MKRWPKYGVPLMLALLSSMTLTACGLTHTTVTIKKTDTNVTCDTMCVVQFSQKHDSEETIEQVRGNNAAYLANCPEKLCSYSLR